MNQLLTYHRISYDPTKIEDLISGYVIKTHKELFIKDIIKTVIGGVYFDNFEFRMYENE